MKSRNLLTAILAVVFLLTLGLYSCGGSDTSLADERVDTPTQASLPAFPLDPAVPHKPTVATDLMQSGSDASAWSNGSSVVGQGIVVDAGTSPVEFAMFEFGTGAPGTDTFSVLLDTAVESGSEYWVGLSDYAAMNWEFHGPFMGNSDIPLTGGNYLSGLGNFYIAAVAANGNAVTVNSVTFNYDDGTTPGVDYVNAAGPFLTSNCASCHSGSSPLAGVGFDSYRAAKSNASAMISKVVDGTHRDLSTADKEMLQAWVDDGLLYGAAVTFTADIQPIIANSCAPCHTSSSSGGVNLNTFAGASAAANSALAQILAETMPQSGGPLDEDEKDLWQVWVDDGKPEN